MILKIGCGVDMMRDMVFIITPEVHGMNDYVMSQMRNWRRGELIQYLIEQYHKTEFK